MGVPFLCHVRVAAPSPSSPRKGSNALKAETRDAGPEVLPRVRTTRSSVQLPAGITERSGYKRFSWEYKCTPRGVVLTLRACHRRLRPGRVAECWRASPQAQAPP